MKKIYLCICICMVFKEFLKTKEGLRLKYKDEKTENTKISSVFIYFFFLNINKI